jgi:hypothetical protein
VLAGTHTKFERRRHTEMYLQGEGQIELLPGRVSFFSPICLTNILKLPNQMCVFSEFDLPFEPPLQKKSHLLYLSHYKKGICLFPQHSIYPHLPLFTQNYACFDYIH